MRPTVAHDPTGSASDWAPIEFGLPVLGERLSDASVSFPATREEVRSAIGDEEVPYDARGHAVTVAEALDQLDRQRFETETELLEAMHPVLEGYRDRRAAGLLARLRSLLPG